MPNATEYISTEYNAIFGNGRFVPNEIRVSPSLYAAYVDELGANARFIDPGHINGAYFRGIRVVPQIGTNGWFIQSWVMGNGRMPLPQPPEPEQEVLDVSYE